MLTNKHLEVYESLIEKNFNEDIVKDMKKLFEDIKDDYVDYRNIVFYDSDPEFREYYKQRIESIPCPDVFFWLNILDI